MERFSVTPNRQAKEAEYISRNIACAPVLLISHVLVGEPIGVTGGLDVARHVLRFLGLAVWRDGETLHHQPGLKVGAVIDKNALGQTNLVCGKPVLPLPRP